MRDEEKWTWDKDRVTLVRKEQRKFHDIQCRTGRRRSGWHNSLKSQGWKFSGGEGRIPPVLGHEVRWAIENIKKCP